VSTLSVHRAFVVHFASGGGPRRRRFHGRVEHLSSGRTAQFSSLAQLLGFVVLILDASRPVVPPSSSEPGRTTKPPAGACRAGRTRVVGRPR
jgi:hypothetical protein